MARNIVIYSDGTGQDGGVRPDQRLSNVYKLYRATRIGPDSPIDPADQIAFYDPGLGTDDDVHGWEKISRFVDKMLGSVEGRGIGRNIVDCYEFIINHWSPGDRIFIIGFSRGAYTARCIAQVLSLCGVPMHEAKQPSVAFRRFTRSARLVAERAVHQVYEHGAGYPVGKYEAERDALASRFRQDFGSDENGIPNAHPHFIGVFDTVAALGAKRWKWFGILALLSLGGAVGVGLVVGLASAIFKFQFWRVFLAGYALGWLVVAVRNVIGSIRVIDDYPNTGSPRRYRFISWRADNYDRGLSGHVGYARQASAIDEDRADFPRVPWGRNTVIRPQQPGEPPPVVQLWFAGNHSDIGGSYAEEESRLSDISLEWMVGEATTIPGPLIVDRTRLNMRPDATGMQHSERLRVIDQNLWWVPKWAPKFLREGWPFGAREPAGYPVHPSVFERFAASSVVQALESGPYRPDRLAGDQRFSAYFANQPAVDEMDLLAAVYAPLAGSPSGKLADLRKPLVDLLTAQDVKSAAFIMLPPNPIEEHDQYRDSLALMWLDRIINRRGFASKEFGCAPAGRPAEARQGRLVFGVEEGSAADLARAVGQMTAVVIAADGSARAVPSIS